jgi:hypothetical protein
MWGYDGVRVRDMSRLVSRIRHRQLGVFLTTSYVVEQASDVPYDGRLYASTGTTADGWSTCFPGAGRPARLKRSGST